MRRREKKTTHLEIRISQSRKDEFMKACEREGVTASDAVREFVDAYIRRSGQVRLKQIVKDLTMKLIQNPVKTAAGFGAPVMGALAAMLIFSTPSVADNTQPIAPPTVYYPQDMASQGISGECRAKFNVSKSGEVETGFDVICTTPGFENAVRSAVETLKFEPKLIDGEPVRREGVVYPINFALE